jgi:3-phenylpropionate/cinnamic acid dioxygenase small subunit
MSDHLRRTHAAQHPTVTEDDDVTYVTDELYAALAREARAARTGYGVADPALRARAQDFCYLEARLLDDRRFSEWAKLFTRDCIYWVPANPEGGDPRDEVAIALSDHRRLLDRVAYLETGVAWAQEPPSRTSRAVSNVEVWYGEDGDVRVRSNFVIWEYRLGALQALPGWQVHRIVSADGDWRIRWKIVTLLQSDGAIPNIAFVV